MRPVRLIATILCAAFMLSAGEPKHYGQPLTLKAETRISEILAKPEAYKGKKVRVRGVITEVCNERGCFLNIKGDKRFTEIMFRVEEGVIVFPAESLGREVVAEGVVNLMVFSEKEQREMCPIEAKAFNRKFDPNKIKGPMKVVRIDGLGADIAS